MNNLRDCGHISLHYGYDSDGLTYCYECCAIKDKEQMDRDGRTIMYLVERHEQVDGHGLEKVLVWYLTNWPGTLEYKVFSARYSYHNWVGENGRIDFWFKDHNGRKWCGYNIGGNNQLAHCKRLKD